MAIRSDSRIRRSDTQEIFMIPGSSFAFSGGRRQTNRHPEYHRLEKSVSCGHKECSILHRDERFRPKAIFLALISR